MTATKNDFKTGQSWIKKPTESLRYNPLLFNHGLCLGVACVAIQGMLNDQLDDFKQITRNLSDFSRRKHTSTPTTINHAEKTFIHAIIKYQHTHKQEKKTLLEARISSTSATLFSSRKISPLFKSPLANAGIIKGVFTIHDLENIFLNHEELSQASNAAPIAFLLTATSHAIALFYHAKEKTWYLVDASKMPTKDLLTPDVTARVVFNSFKKIQPDKLAIKIRAFSTQNHVSAAKNHINLLNVSMASHDLPRYVQH